MSANAIEYANANVHVHVDDTAEVPLRRRRADEPRQTTTFRIRPSVAAAFDAFCEARGYAKGPALEAAIAAFLAQAPPQ